MGDRDGREDHASGDMLFIPKGIGHRSMLCEDSTDENVLIELKIL